MMNLLSVASWALLIGAAGQYVFYASLFPRLDSFVTYMFLAVPWLAIFVISFCRLAPCGPRPFRYILIAAMCWYSAAALAAEVFYSFLHPIPNGTFPIIPARFLMYLGACSFVVFVRVCIALRRHEAPSDEKE